MLLYVRPMLATILPQPLGLSFSGQFTQHQDECLKERGAVQEFGMSN